MEFTYFIGCDVSKNELDFAVMQGKQYLFHKEISNDPVAIKTFVNELKQLSGFELSKAVFCMEHTGIYNNHLLVYLHKKSANICLEAATQIKNSMGNIRGKNDKVDAIRIAEYAYKNRGELHLWQPKREVIQKLAYWSVARTRLLNVKKQLKTPLKESRAFVNKSTLNQTIHMCQLTLNSIEADLKKIENAIDELIQSDAELKRLFAIISSVDGIGPVTAIQFIITTNEFKDINDPKKFACYSGVAPFERESGQYKGKARVSSMSNKTVKTLLHMAALTAIVYNQNLKLYYERKVNEDKKNKMLVLNAVRNKLVHYVFACVNQNRKYEKIYTGSVV